jgi:hypothetical protein
VLAKDLSAQIVADVSLQKIALATSPTIAYQSACTPIEAEICVANSNGKRLSLGFLSAHAVANGPCFDPRRETLSTGPTPVKTARR